MLFRKDGIVRKRLHLLQASTVCPRVHKFAIQHVNNGPDRRPRLSLSRRSTLHVSKFRTYVAVRYQ